MEQLAMPVAPGNRRAIFACLALMLVFPFFSPYMEHAVGSIASVIGEIPARMVSEGVIWGYGALVLGIALFGEPRTLASIGLARPSLWVPLWAIGATIVLLALGGCASFVTYQVLQEPNHTPAQIEGLVRGSLVYALFLALRGGVIEEVLYRGLAIEQLTVLTGRRGLAAVIATLAFVAAHIAHFDLLQLIPIATVSAGFALLYIWRRDLWINIIAHTLIDGIALGAVALHATNLY
jgi:membrane protease YdiL (CAAX protease family)